MKFKLDENLSPLLAPLFTSAGHEAHSVVAQSLGGQPDERIIDVCSREQRPSSLSIWTLPTFRPIRPRGMQASRYCASQTKRMIKWRGRFTSCWRCCYMST